MGTADPNDVVLRQEVGDLGERPAWPPLSKPVLVAYLVALVWLVLFKLTLDWPALVRDSRVRELALVPFAHVSWATRGESVSNVLAFIPFGLLLDVVVKRASLWSKLAGICAVSVAFEITQYVLAIGVTDVTDVVTNTSGGLLGLLLYRAVRRGIPEARLDRAVTVIGGVLLVAVVLYRLLLLRFT